MKPLITINEVSSLISPNYPSFLLFPYFSPYFSYFPFSPLVISLTSQLPILLLLLQIRHPLSLNKNTLPRTWKNHHLCVAKASQSNIHSIPTISPLLFLQFHHLIYVFFMLGFSEQCQSRVEGEKVLWSKCFWVQKFPHVQEKELR